MDKNNIWSIVVFFIVVSTLSVFTTLFFVKRNTVPQETIATAIANKVPARVEVKFKPTKPDCVYVSDITVKKDGEEVSLVASKKTFREVLLSNNNKTVFSIKSEVIAYAKEPIDFIENNITIDTNKKQLQEVITSTIPKKKSSALVPVLVGIGIGGVIVETINLLAK